MKKILMILAVFAMAITTASAAIEHTAQTPEHKAQSERKEVGDRKPVSERKPMSERKPKGERKPANKGKVNKTDSLAKQASQAAANN